VMINVFDEIIKLMAPLLTNEKTGYLNSNTYTLRKSIADDYIRQLYSSAIYSDGTVPKSDLQNASMNVVASTVAQMATPTLISYFQSFTSSITGAIKSAATNVLPVFDNPELTEAKAKSATKVLWDITRIAVDNNKRTAVWSDVKNQEIEIKKVLLSMKNELLSSSKGIYNKEVEFQKGAASLDYIFSAYSKFFDLLLEDGYVTMLNNALLYNSQKNEQLNAYYNFLLLSSLQIEFDMICDSTINVTSNNAKYTPQINSISGRETLKKINELMNLLVGAYEKDNLLPTLFSTINTTLKTEIGDIAKRRLSDYTIFNKMNNKLEELKKNYSFANQLSVSSQSLPISSQEGINYLVSLVHANKCARENNMDFNPDDFFTNNSTEINSDNFKKMMDAYNDILFSSKSTYQEEEDAGTDAKKKEEETADLKRTIIKSDSEDTLAKSSSINSSNSQQLTTEINNTIPGVVTPMLIAHGYENAKNTVKTQTPPQSSNNNRQPANNKKFKN